MPERAIDLTVENLANALEAIRRKAWLCWAGQAFEPGHMYDVASMAAQALCGEMFEAPVPLETIYTNVEERAAEIEKLFEEGEG
jgi:hypothetical protein